MDPGQVIAFAVVLDREFPVRGDLEREAAVRAAVVDRLVELRPAGDEIGVHLLEGGGVAREVHEDHVAPDMAAAPRRGPAWRGRCRDGRSGPGPPTWGVATRRPSLA
jgi:hypothetical protein